jgi:hypothetical protein
MGDNLHAQGRSCLIHIGIQEKMIECLKSVRMVSVVGILGLKVVGYGSALQKQVVLES